MTSCIAAGWGSGPYGLMPWGGGLNVIAGGPLPSTTAFDIYCVGPCGPMSVLLTYEGVNTVGDSSQFFVDSTTGDQVLASGGTFLTSGVQIVLTTSVTNTFTSDFTLDFEHLPNDFSDIVSRHVLVSVTDASGPCFVLFFSKIGIGYAGAVHFDGSGNLVLDSTFQVLPGSATLISELTYYSFRVACDHITGAAYIFVTKTADLIQIGHQLRYVMPIILASSLSHTPTDQTLISVRGTLAQPSEVSIDTLCLGADFTIPNSPPTADAGLDQAARTCSIIQLDGTKSFDPEGANIAYKWRLLDAPLGSAFSFDGVDGSSFPLPMPTGFTNKFYSPSLAVVDAIDSISITAGLGDVLVVSGIPYDIIGKGTDGPGFFIQIDGFILPDNFSNAPFKLLRQRGISGITSAKPTFFPDIPGIYKFDLVVFDGQLFSEPSITITNVTESPIPRGCIPDVRFLWGYLSDFWNLVDDKDRLTTFFSASAQIAATELLSLWQIDYSKSLRDVQRTFQRRWLNYELNIDEPFPELTTIAPIFGGLRQIFPVAGLAGIPGTTLSITIPFFAADGISSLSSSYTFTGSGNLTAQNVLDQLSQFLLRLDSRFVITTIANRSGTLVELRIQAPFSFSTGVSDTAPIFVAPLTNTEPSGAGSGIAVNAYKTDRSLLGLSIPQGAILALGQIGYRVVGVIDDPGDDWPFQRISLLDSLPTSPPTSWAIPGKVTSRIVDFYNSSVDFQDLSFYEIFDSTTQQALFLRLQGAFIAQNDTTSMGVTGLGILANYQTHPTRIFDVFFLSVTRLTHLPIDDLISDIPYLQEKINSTDDTAVFRRNIDFYLEEFRGQNSIRFAFTNFADPDNIWGSVDAIPARLWAETTYIDNSPIIEQNFGIPAAFTLDDLSQLPNNVDYLSAVRGLWYSYFNGPTLFNLRVGTQILLGLPFAEETGIITEIRNDFSVTNGRILVQDKKNTEIVRSYSYPASLSPEINPTTNLPYAVGDLVSQFAPLVTGVEVVDWVKDPHWFEGYLQQGSFFEIEKFHKFLVRVDSAAFNLSSLLFVQSFILRIKPTYTFPLFVVKQQLGTKGDTEVSTTDLIEPTGSLKLFAGACFLGNEMATMLDQGNPAGGGWVNKLDTDSDPTTPLPTYPTSQPVAWGLDRDLMCPEDSILVSACTTLGAPAVPTLDNIFALDSYVSTASIALFEDSWVTDVPSTWLNLFNDFTVTGNTTITDINLHIVGDAGATDHNFTLSIVKNGTEVSSSTFTQDSILFTKHISVSLAVVIGDVLRVRVKPTTIPFASTNWKSIQVELGTLTLWSLDTTLAAGTYCAYRNI